MEFSIIEDRIKDRGTRIMGKEEIEKCEKRGGICHFIKKILNFF